MKNENIDVLLENQSLKSEFAARGLDLDQVFFPIPDDLERENRILLDLLDWVQKYTECKNRKKMESEGYYFPPIEPDISPEDDWYRFECWMDGRPIRKKLKNLLPPSFTPKTADQLTDDELLFELQKLTELLAEIRVSIDLDSDVPPRLVYEHLLETLDEEFDITIEAFWHLDGCSGYCPGCFQRPWCESGSRSCWPEDEEEGKMFVIDQVKKYVSSSPISLQLLQEFQREEDKKFDEFKENQKGTRITIDPIPFDFDNNDDLPF